MAAGVPTYEFAYDSAGRVTQIINSGTGNALNILYNFQGNISEVRDTGGNPLAWYAYDTKNRRIRKWIRGVGGNDDRDIHYVVPVR